MSDVISCVCAYLSVYLYVCLCVYLYKCVSDLPVCCRSVCLYTCLSVCQRTCAVQYRCACACVYMYSLLLPMYAILVATYSATWPSGVRRLADQYLTQQPFQVTVGSLDIRVRRSGYLVGTLEEDLLLTHDSPLLRPVTLCSSKWSLWMRVRRSQGLAVTICMEVFMVKKLCVEFLWG